MKRGRCPPSIEPRRRGLHPTPEDAHGSDDPRQRERNVVEIAGVDANLVAAPVDLNPDPVEFPFHRSALKARDRLSDRLCGRGQHRQDGPKEFEVHLKEALLAAGESDFGRAREIS
jgi:hypothetical protein